MRVRPLVTLIILMAMTVNGVAARPRTTASVTPVSVHESELSPEEEREARQVAQRFSRLFRKSRDIGSLMDELFVADYAERLRLRNMQDPIVSFRENVPLDVGPGELRSFAIAVMNLWAMMVEWQDAGRCPEKPEEGKAPEPPCEQEIFPPNVLKFIKSDKRLALFVSGMLGEKIAYAEAGSGSNGEASDEEDLVFENAQDLRVVTAALARAGSLMREHLSKLQASGKMPGVTSQADGVTDVRLMRVSEEGGFYGWPAGSNLICVDVGVFHLDLVRIDGRLKILAITPLTDSD